MEESVKSDTVDKFNNLPVSKEFVTGRRGRLHVRTSWPTNNQIKGVVFYVHGYNSHFNRPAHHHMSKSLNSFGFAYCGMDLYGHGYSEGPRALVETPQDLVTSVVETILLVYGASKNGSLSDEKFSVDSQAKKLSNETPLFLMGQSMGGAVVTLVGQTLQSSYSQINLQGIIFLCPAVGVPAPSPLVRFLLDQVIVPLFPHDSMPRWMASSLSDSATWENKHFIEYIKNDRFPENPHGLCWGKPLRFESARNILSLSELALDALPCINVPVLIFHDPNDKVVPYSCSEEILCKITVSLDHKKIINVDHGLHDLISNKVELISLSLIEWLDSFSQIK